MAKYEKIFIADSCPNCGDQLIVSTDCSESNDTEFDSFFYDGDEVVCSANCGFLSSVSINEDDSSAYIADGNIEDLEVTD